MANNDFFKIVYVLLQELYETKKEGEKVKKEDIDYQRFNIHYSYYADIICELLDNGYIKGVIVRTTKLGRVINIDNIDITMKGIEYLQNNSTMKKVYEALKNAKDLIPGM